MSMESSTVRNQSVICDVCQEKYETKSRRPRKICDPCLKIAMVNYVMPVKEIKPNRVRNADYFEHRAILWEKMLAKRKKIKLSKVVKTECWVMGNRNNNFEYQGVLHKYESYKVHLVSLVVKLDRPINNGLTGDHLCYVKGCFNPDHLEEVSREENGRRAGTLGHKPTGMALPQRRNPAVSFKESAYTIRFGSDPVKRESDPELSN